MQLVQGEPELYGALGIGPFRPSFFEESDAQLMKELMDSEPKIVAIGAIGLISVILVPNDHERQVRLF